MRLRTRKQWTTKEQNLLALMYGIESVALIAQKLGRTESSINNRAHILGLEARNGRQVRKKHCRETIKRLIGMGLAASEVAAKVGTTPRMIRWIAQRDLPTPLVEQLRENGKRSHSRNSNSGCEA